MSIKSNSIEQHDGLPWRTHLACHSTKIATFGFSDSPMSKSVDSIKIKGNFYSLKSPGKSHGD